MKVKERAAADLQRILEQSNNLENWQRNDRIITAMRKQGWNVTTATLLETARDLGFPVVGLEIFGQHD